MIEIPPLHPVRLPQPDGVEFAHQTDIGQRLLQIRRVDLALPGLRGIEAQLHPQQGTVQLAEAIVLAQDVVRISQPRGLAELWAYGLIEPSFLPPPAICALRALTRPRVALVETRTQAKNRVTKILEDTNIKVAHVVSDVSGTSGRRTRAVLMAGERAPQTLAARDANLFGAHVSVAHSVPGEKGCRGGGP